MSNLDIIFKRLLWIDIAVLVLIVFLAFTGTNFGLDPTLVELQEYLSEQISLIFLLPGLIVLVIAIASYPLLFKFKQLGRLLYLWSGIIACSMLLFMGPSVMDPVSGFLESISSALTGALLILMYFTPLKEKFKTSQNNNVSSSNITSELERISKLHKEGLISDEDFKKAKEKLLNN